MSDGGLGRIQSRLVIGGINFKQKIAGLHLLIVVYRNVDNRLEILTGVVSILIVFTRIPVYVLLQKMAAGETEAELLSAYPQLSKAIPDGELCHKYK